MQTARDYDRDILLNALAIPLAMEDFKMIDNDFRCSLECAVHSQVRDRTENGKEKWEYSSSRFRPSSWRKTSLSCPPCFRLQTFPPGEENSWLVCAGDGKNHGLCFVLEFLCSGTDDRDSLTGNLNEIWEAMQEDFLKASGRNFPGVFTLTLPGMEESCRRLAFRVPRISLAQLAKAWPDISGCLADPLADAMAQVFGAAKRLTPFVLLLSAAGENSDPTKTARP